MDSTATSEPIAATSWSLVARAQSDDMDVARAANGEICGQYWFPIYAYSRRRGSSPEDAEDLTQGFFVHLVEKDLLKQADRSKGRLRAFLFSCVKNFNAGEYRKAAAERRGGSFSPLSFDADEGEELWAACGEVSDAESAFDRAWARTLLRGVLGELGEKMESKGKGELFAALRPTLEIDAAAVDLPTIARALDISDTALRVAAHRLRQQYAELLRTRVRETLLDPADVDAELRQLLVACAQP